MRWRARAAVVAWRGLLQRVQISKLVLFPCLTGALTGAAAIAFVELLNAVQWCAIGSTELPLRVLPHLPWYQVLLVPALGGLLVGPLVRYWAPEAQGHGVPEVIEAVMLRGGRIRRRVAFVKSLASVFATVVSRAYFGDHPAFVVQPYELDSVFEIGTYAGLGVLCGLVGNAFVWTMGRFESLASRVPLPTMWRPAAGGLLLGLLIVFIPNLYGVGYATMDAALDGNLSWQSLALLLPFKIMATSLTLASGWNDPSFSRALAANLVAARPHVRELPPCGKHGRARQRLGAEPRRRRHDGALHVGAHAAGGVARSAPTTEPPSGIRGSPARSRRSCSCPRWPSSSSWSRRCGRAVWPAAAVDGDRRVPLFALARRGHDHSGRAVHTGAPVAGQPYRYRT